MCSLKYPQGDSRYELLSKSDVLELCKIIKECIGKHQINKVRTMVDPNSRSDPKLQELMKVLIDWINDVLVGERIIVKDLAVDLYDGQVLQKLFEKLEIRDCSKAKAADRLEKINETLKLPPRSIKWNVDSVHAKSLVAILHLLVALSHYSGHQSDSQTMFPSKWLGSLRRHERDAFDTLFNHAPDKLNVVKKTLITFVNKRLNKLNLEVTELETQFADGVYLVLLMGLLEGYFVPLHSFFLTPDSFEQKVLNVSFAFELMQDGGLEKPKPRPEDIVNCDLKSMLRVLYNLFTKYRNMERRPALPLPAALAAGGLDQPRNHLTLLVPIPCCVLSTSPATAQR
uniref:Calponin-homology (CH) domain-containing protein n=1 Tax=Sciurus vulgaris TaxID=55149 RepID=A0A8D2JPE6_SCIVU